MPRRIVDALLLCAALACTGAASARTSDRNQPMDAESNQNTCNLGVGGQCVLTGAVQITQGTLGISAAKAVIYTAKGDISRAVFTGGPVQLKQQLDDGKPMSARANNVDYNLKTEVVVFSGGVKIEQPSGSISGERVVYNLKTGTIDGGGQGSGRVRMRIVPTSGKAQPAQDNAAARTPGKTMPTDPPATDAPATDAPTAPEAKDKN